MKRLVPILLLLCILAGCAGEIPPAATPAPPPVVTEEVSLAVSASGIPEYTGEKYVVLNNNIPEFDQELIEIGSYEYYSQLDQLGRCGAAVANLGQDLMPTEDRGSISHVYPSGWNQAEYDIVDGKMLYNRCHLIGFQLAGENANEKNLITGTRYFNVEGMLPFEDQVAEYIHSTGNRVLFRVTPMYEGEELVARGVQMDAWSVEDGGEGVCFSVFVFNVQPGITINYLTGESVLEGEELPSQKETTYVVNRNSKKIHLPTCSGAESMKKENRWEFTGTLAELTELGYEVCGNCLGK